jgi:nucleotide-binding universal stress UspA family protein
MKTILVLTDLSKKSENAAVFALKIAEKLKANIVLFHSFENFQSVNIPESGSWVYEDYEMIKNESLTDLKKLEDHMLTHHNPGAFEPEISLLNELGIDLSSSVNQLVRDKKVDLIVMGAEGHDTMSHVLNGSDAGSLLEHANCPVLFVPETGNFDHFKTIVFANDLKKDYAEAIGFLIDIARMDNSHIILTHFGEYDVKVFGCLRLIENELAYENVASRLLPMEKMDEQLCHFATSAKADLIVLIHHKQDYIKNFIFGSDSKNMLKQSNIPLLILQG